MFADQIIGFILFSCLTHDFFCQLFPKLLKDGKLVLVIMMIPFTRNLANYPCIVIK